MNSRALTKALSFLDSWLPYRLGQTGIPGLSIAVAHKEKIVWSRAFGLANIAAKTPMTTNHLFCVASQSKMFTAVAILQLTRPPYSLRLEDSVTRYLPWLGNHPDKRIHEITVRQLLTHSAGLSRDLPDSDFWQLTQPLPDTKALRAAILQTDIVLEPNTKLKYSNAGYAILGQLIEAISGQSYTKYITERIIQPLGLHATFADYSSHLQSNIVTGYGTPHYRQRMTFEKRRPAHALASVVGVHTTPADMCRFGSILSGSTPLIDSASQKEFQQSQWIVTDGYDAGLEFGLGLEVMSLNGRKLFGHSGHLAGHLTATFVDPEARCTVAVMANCKDAPSTDIALGIFGVIDHFNECARSPAQNRTRFNARLYSPLATVEIVATADRIVAIDPNDWQPFAYCEELEQVGPATLRITTDGSVFNEGEYVRYTFDRNTIVTVTYAGGSLLPEKAYLARLQTSM